MKKVYYILALMLLPFATIGITSCDDPITPKADTTIVTKTDTIIRQIMRLDTVHVDTIVKDTARELINDRVIIGYVYSGFPTVPDPFLNTHICYAFGKLDMSDDSVYLGFSVQNEDRFRKVVALKEKNPNLKIQLSFSNSAAGGGFSRMSSVPEYRQQFAQDCKNFCDKWGIDGVDLDWEFPGMAYNASYHFDPAHDVDNYTELFKDIRAVFGSDYLLTYAGPTEQKQAIEGGYRYVDNLAVEPYVDWVNLMCYDFCSAPRPHNAMVCDGYWDIMRTYRSYYVAEYPMHKLVLGVAFYGRHEFDNDKEWMYQELLRLYKVYPNYYRRQWNNAWKVPYCERKVDGKWQMWCSYDDPQSIAYKGDWLISKGMRGLMYWEVEGDNSTKDLQHACYDAMKKEMFKDTSFVYQVDSVMVNDTSFVTYNDTTITIKDKK